MEDFNRQYFSKADVAKGLHIKLIAFLLDNFESEEYRLDLRAYHDDCGAVIVEWARVLWNHEDEMGHFEFIGDGDEVVKEAGLENFDRGEALSAEAASKTRRRAKGE